MIIEPGTVEAVEKASDELCQTIEEAFKKHQNYVASLFKTKKELSDHLGFLIESGIPPLFNALGYLIIAHAAETCSRNRKGLSNKTAYLLVRDNVMNRLRRASIDLYNKEGEKIFGEYQQLRTEAEKEPRSHSSK